MNWNFWLASIQLQSPNGHDSPTPSQDFAIKTNDLGLGMALKTKYCLHLPLKRRQKSRKCAHTVNKIRKNILIGYFLWDIGFFSRKFEHLYEKSEFSTINWVISTKKTTFSQKIEQKKQNFPQKLEFLCEKAVFFHKISFFPQENSFSITKSRVFPRKI